MENSILIARFVGPYIIVIAIGLLLNLKTYRKIVEGFFDNAAIVYIAGLMAFVAGLAIVLFHNIWAMDWRIIITLFGWSALIKGTLFVVSPAASVKMAQVFIKNIKLVVIPWIGMLVLGIFLVFKGY
ncbi:MAG: hypothetical protein PHT50_06355 [Candidatus Omnitrophica bacterium]|nr:hypothetical protein [Candidatus Omnitrophota bacterium]